MTRPSISFGHPDRAGRRIRVVHPVDAAGLLLPSQARSFARTLTSPAVACLPTFGGNLAGRHNPAPFFRAPQRQPKHDQARQSPNVLHPSVSPFLRHWSVPSVLNMKGQKSWNFLGRRCSEEIWKGAA